MILLIDNYDSFTYNLEQMLREIHDDVKVVRNDELTVDEIKTLQPAGIVLSPGPGHPKEAGICMQVIEELSGQLPILGICLGMQAMAEVFGAQVVHAREIVHGKAQAVFHENTPIFKDMPNPFQAARYHSLCVEQNSLSADLRLTAKTKDGQVMAIGHATHPTFGLQFHPESILTENGYTMLRAFAEICQSGGEGC